MLKSLLKIFTVGALSFVFFCHSANRQIQDSSQIIESNTKVQNKREIIFAEPVTLTGIKSSDKIPDKAEAIWKDFTADGQYRLAQPFDMTFSETAKSELSRQGKSSIVPYEYVWGDLGFNKRIEDDHLAAIVVNTAREGNDKFGLVIFSPVKNTKGKYDINWLYRDMDLSKTTVNRASGELYVTTYSEDGSLKSCSVVWNKKLKKFECK